MTTFDGNTPVFQQVADHFRRQILDGTLREGDQMTSTTQFAATFKVNPGTVVRGYSLLVDEGLVEKRRGIGMFVAEGASDKLAASERERFFSEHLPPVIEQAKLLGITDTELTAHLRAAWAKPKSDM